MHESSVIITGININDKSIYNAICHSFPVLWMLKSVINYFTQWNQLNGLLFWQSTYWLLSQVHIARSCHQRRLKTITTWTINPWHAAVWEHVSINNNDRCLSSFSCARPDPKIPNERRGCKPLEPEVEANCEKGTKNSDECSSDSDCENGFICCPMECKQKKCMEIIIFWSRQNRLWIISYTTFICVRKSHTTHRRWVSSITNS